MDLEREPRRTCRNTGDRHCPESLVVDPVVETAARLVALAPYPDPHENGLESATYGNELSGEKRLQRIQVVSHYFPWCCLVWIWRSKACSTVEHATSYTKVNQDCADKDWRIQSIVKGTQSPRPSAKLW